MSHRFTNRTRLVKNNGNVKFGYTRNLGKNAMHRLEINWETIHKLLSEVSS